MGFAKAAAAGLLLLALASCTSSQGTDPGYVDESAKLTTELRHWAEINHLGPLDPHANQDAKLVELGRLLFFDKELSGNRDTSCATCHQMTMGTSDGLSLSIGTGGNGVGLERVRGEDKRFHPRNSQDLFNRGAEEWGSTFWDSRVFKDEETGELHSPAGDKAPQMDNLMQLQALFPFTVRDEMRGFKGEKDVFGKHNELADFDDDDLPGIWAAVMKRVLAIPAYRDLFADAYPGVAPEDMEFSLVAKAIAAFVTKDFAAANTPWDRFLAGEDNVMSDAAKRGGFVYMGEGRCVLCHGTNLLTDQELYDIAIPSIGPGPDFDPNNPVDRGLERLTGKPEDMYAFRTPPLRNVALTGPYMHNGAIVDLEDAVRYHFNHLEAARHFDPSRLAPELQPSVYMDEDLLTEMAKNPPDELETPIVLTDAQVSDLMAFLNALTDPASVNLTNVRPASVPSGMDMNDQ